MGGVSPASDGEKQVHRLEAKADASALDPRSHKTVPEAVATMQPSLQSFDHKIIGAATPAAPNPSEASQVGGLTNLPPDGTGALPLQAAGTATAITAQQHTVCADGISLVSGPPPSSPPGGDWPSLPCSSTPSPFPLRSPFPAAAAAATASGGGGAGAG